MAKIMELDLSDDRLIGFAADLVDDHNYISALKMLNKNAEISGDDEDSLMLYAEIFEDMGLYEKSVNGWFRYLDEADLDGDLSECYEGLASSFMNIGNEHFSAYYYNKLLAFSDDMDAETRSEILQDFISANGDEPLKFAYPPALADCREIISAGINSMKAGDFDGAVEEFEEIAEENPNYISARNYIAMCKIITDKADEAEQECLNILKRNPGDVQAMTTLSAVKTEKGLTEEAVALARKLLAANVKNPDDLYKIATVCCENKLHAEAYDTFCKLPEDYDYDLNALYFKAVSAFNSARYEECFNAFDNLVTVFPESVTGRYYYKEARDRVKKGDKTELSYFYRLPVEIRESSLKILALYAGLPTSAAKKFEKEVDLSACIAWCFDECEGKGGELQKLAAQVAVKGRYDALVRKILLNAFLDDKMKMTVLHALAERNDFDVFGVVTCNVYSRVTLRPVCTGTLKRKYFVRANARLISHFAVIDDDYGEEFVTAAEGLYEKLESEGRLDEIKNQDVLTAAVYEYSGVRVADIDGERIYEFFNARRDKVEGLLAPKV